MLITNWLNLSKWESNEFADLSQNKTCLGIFHKIWQWCTVHLNVNTVLNNLFILELPFNL